MKKILQHIIDRFGRYLLGGIVIIVPFGLTGYFFFAVFNNLHKLIQFFIQHIPFINLESVNPVLGIVITLGAVCFLGYIDSNFIIKSLINFLDSVLVHTPLVSPVYVSIKDYTSVLLGKFDKPVLVMVNEKLGTQKIGFVTQENLNHLGIEGKMAIYMPDAHSWSGKVYIVLKENVEPLSISVSGWQILRFVASGGSANVAPSLALKQGRSAIGDSR